MGRRHVRRAIAVMLLASAAVVAPQGLTAADGHGVGQGSRVLPPSATPYGYSRADMTGLLALFTTSGNNPAYLPETPFRILHTDPTMGVTQGTFVTGGGEPCEPPRVGCGLFFTQTGTFANRFEVSADETFFVPVDNADDSPDVVGTFPTRPAAAKRYVFDRRVLGGEDFAITIDSRRTALGPAYVAGPVETEPLLDGGGTHMITIGAFLSPMSPGTHTVRITGGYFGDGIWTTYKLSFIRLDFTYEVVVTGS